MPTTTRQLAKIAKVAEQTVRNYTREYAELLSPQARGDVGPRLFSDEDVRIFCSIATLRKEGVPTAEVVERIQRGDVYIDLATPTPHQTTPNAPQATQTAPEAPQALMLVRSDLQRQINEIKRTQATLMTAYLLWGGLWGVVVGLAIAALYSWILYLSP